MSTDADRRPTIPNVNPFEALASADTGALEAWEQIRRRVLGLRQPRWIAGRYEARAVIGSGGMGMVVEVVDHHLGRPAALKILRAQGSFEGEQRRYSNLRSEARALARVNHPNVVPVFDIGRIRYEDQLGLPLGAPTRVGTPYIVMERVEGSSLGTWLAEPRSWPQIRRAFVAAAHGLAAAHEVGIVHRDFKPANVLVSAKGTVKVADFGLAVASSDAETTLGGPSNGGSTGGSGERRQVAGTPPFMSPEQLRGERVDARTDQFAWAVALHRVVFGCDPYPSTFAEMVAAKNHPVVFRGRRRAGVPRAIEVLLARALQPRPSDRYPSMAELVGAVERLEQRRSWWPVMFGGSVVLAVGSSLTPADADCELLGATTASEEIAAVAARLEPSDLRRTVEQAGELLERDGTRWEEARVEACATKGEHRGRAVVCLRAHRRHVETIVSAIVSGGTPSLSRAAGAMVHVGSPESCLAQEPAKAGDFEQVLWEQLAEVEAMVQLGHMAQASARAEVLVGRARRREDPELLARALLAQHSVISSFSCQESVALLEEAHHLAARRELEPLARFTAQAIVNRRATCLRDAQGARHWLEQARAWQGRLVADELSQERMALSEALVLEVEGNIADAEAIYERVLFRDRSGEQWPSYLSSYMRQYTLALVRGGRMEDAIRVGRTTVAELSRALGPSHPRVGQMMMLTAGTLWEAGYREEGGEMLEQGLEVMRQAHGDDNPTVLLARYDLVMMRSDQTPVAETVAECERLLQRQRVVLGPYHFTVGLNERNLWSVRIAFAIRQGDRQTLVDAERALKGTLARSEFVANRHVILHSLITSEYADLLLVLGRWEEAFDLGDAMVQLGHEDHDNARILHRGHAAAGQAAARLGRPDEAVRRLEQSMVASGAMGRRRSEEVLAIAALLAIAGRHDQVGHWLEQVDDPAGQEAESSNWISVPAVKGLIEGLALLDEGRATEAAQSFRDGLQELPDDDVASDDRFMLEVALVMADRATGAVVQPRLASLAERCRRARGQDSAWCSALAEGRIPGQLDVEGRPRGG